LFVSDSVPVAGTVLMPALMPIASSILRRRGRCTIRGASAPSKDAQRVHCLDAVPAERKHLRYLLVWHGSGSPSKCATAGDRPIVRRGRWPPGVCTLSARVGGVGCGFCG